MALLVYKPLRPIEDVLGLYLLPELAQITAAYTAPTFSEAAVLKYTFYFRGFFRFSNACCLLPPNHGCRCAACVYASPPSTPCLTNYSQHRTVEGQQVLCAMAQSVRESMPIYRDDNSVFCNAIPGVVEGWK